MRTKTSYEELPLGGSLFFSLTVDGIPPPTYQWYKNGYAVNHQTNQVLTIHRANTSHSGTYSCDIQNIAGSLLWLELTVHVQDT